jgi:hypothetical protein
MRIAVVLLISACAAAFASFACGPSSDKPPLTPDSDQSAEAGAPPAANQPGPPAAK